MSERSLPIAGGSFGSKTLKGQVALVTGAGSGIGFETARSLAWLGALDHLEKALAGSDPGLLAAAVNVPLDKLVYFYENLKKHSSGYVKDPAELEEALQQIDSWQKDVEELAGIFKI